MNISEKDFIDKCKTEFIAKLLNAGLNPQYVAQILAEKLEYVFEYLSNISKYAWSWTLSIKQEIRRIMGI